MLGLKRLRERLESRHTELSHRIERIERDVRHQDHGLDDDFQERAVEVQNDAVLDALDVSGRDELMKIEGALERLDRGQYGRCTVCGDPIGRARLEALPFAERCIVCAERTHAG